MKQIAVLVILFGSGLAAYGISGFGGEFSTNTRFDPPQLSGSFEWSQESQIEIVVGVVSLVGGLILRKDSK
jgi:uncharacterized membrane protein YphA (DoxX/SURF4 family)